VLGVEKTTDGRPDARPERTGPHPHRPPLLPTVTRIPCDIFPSTATPGYESIPSEEQIKTTSGAVEQRFFGERKCRVDSVRTAATRSEISAHRLSAVAYGGSGRSRHFGFGIIVPQNTKPRGFPNRTPSMEAKPHSSRSTKGKKRKKNGSVEMWTCVPADGMGKRR